MIENIGLELRIVSNLAYNKMNRQTMKAENVSVHQCLVLQYLASRAASTVYQRNIESLFSIRRSTANQMLRTLEERGFIQRIQSPENARRNILVLTDKGEAACKNLNAHMELLLKELVGGIDRGELEQFQITLRKL